MNNKSHLIVINNINNRLTTLLSLLWCHVKNINYPISQRKHCINTNVRGLMKPDDIATRLPWTCTYVIMYSLLLAGMLGLEAWPRPRGLSRPKFCGLGFGLGLEGPGLGLVGPGLGLKCLTSSRLGSRRQ